MPRKSRYEKVRCQHFAWTLICRSGVWYADGRSNPVNAGRHSLGTKNKEQALKRLHALDQARAEDLGLISRSESRVKKGRPLTLQEGREAYERYIGRPRVAGGVKKSTQKRYRTVFDKFTEFADNKGVIYWNHVSENVLYDYAAHLEGKQYAQKSISIELVILVGCFRWLLEQGLLSGMDPLKLKLRKTESQPSYCYTYKEVSAIVAHCDKSKSLHWLRDVIITLAYTGLRISELAVLQWSDVDLANNQLTLHDESGRAAGQRDERRQTKSGRSRSLPLHPELRKVLKAKERKGRYVFYGPRGGRFKPDTARRIFVREVIAPLAAMFPSEGDEKGFEDGRFHSFRHYFCSKCANSNVAERIVMKWLGHADSEMIRHYYHLHDEEAKRQMNHLDFLGVGNGRSVGESGDTNEEEDAEPINPDEAT